MPNRRLDLGSGGWAMSAKEYGKFLVALFDQDLMFTNVKVSGNNVNALNRMQSERLGMFTTTGSGGDTYYVHRGANSWSGSNGGSVGGKSIWMHFPPNDITVVIQINSHNNANTAAGIERDQMLREAYDEVYSSPKPSETEYPMNMFVSRAQDGWMVGRGVRSGGTLGRTDYDLVEGGNWAITRFYQSAGRTYAMHYNPDNGGGNGTLKVQRVKKDGTLAETVYSSDNWRRGWTHLEVFEKSGGQDVYLLLYDKNQGKLRTYRIDNLGKPVAPKITDVDVTSGFNIVKIVRLQGQDHLLRHNSTTGLIHVRQLNNNGSWGPAVYEKTWKKGFTTFEFFQTGNGQQYLLRYKEASGHANILRFPATVAGLEQTTEVLDQTWSRNWKVMRFFRTSEGTFNFRYNPTNGNVRIQKISLGGAFINVVYEKDGDWLTETKAEGVFDIDTTGWTNVEFFQAIDAGLPTSPGGFEVRPPRVDTDNDDLQKVAALPPTNARRIDVKRAEIKTTVRRGRLHLDWKADPGVFYIAEKSTDLRNWEPVELIDGAANASLNFQRELGETKRDATGAPIPNTQEYFRIRTLETAPDPVDEPLPARFVPPRQ